MCFSDALQAPLIGHSWNSESCANATAQQPRRRGTLLTGRSPLLDGLQACLCEHAMFPRLGFNNGSWGGWSNPPPGLGGVGDPEGGVVAREIRLDDMPETTRRRHHFKNSSLGRPGGAAGAVGAAPYGAAVDGVGGDGVGGVASVTTYEPILESALLQSRGGGARLHLEDSTRSVDHSSIGLDRQHPSMSTSMSTSLHDSLLFREGEGGGAGRALPHMGGGEGRSRVGGNGGAADPSRRRGRASMGGGGGARRAKDNIWEDDSRGSGYTDPHHLDSHTSSHLHGQSHSHSQSHGHMHGHYGEPPGPHGRGHGALFDDPYAHGLTPEEDRDQILSRSLSLNPKKHKHGWRGPPSHGLGRYDGVAPPELFPALLVDGGARGGGMYEHEYGQDYGYANQGRGHHAGGGGM